MEETALQRIIRGRRSIRRFAPTPVDREKVLACLEAARLAPSAHNAQPWRFLVVDDPNLRAKLAAAAFSGIFSSSKFAAAAPVIVIMLVVHDLVTNVIGTRLRKTPFHWIDMGIAGEHIVLQAEELGLATCWIGWFHEKRLRKALKIPRRYRVAALMPIGYAEKRPTRSPQKKSLEEIAWFNEIGGEGGGAQRVDYSGPVTAGRDDEGPKRA
jgi:nitroreductase